MMRLISIQTIQISRAAESDIGAVPILGEPVTVTRGWFQCENCEVIGAFDEMVSPMMPPPCPQCEPVTVTTQ